ncbi:MAG TPA: metallopeptidase family protein [Dermatophilaceae bacterium]|nr:metallopeptidase family protein [Dermatophilaceae bacterium]
MRSRADDFDDLVIDAATRIERRWKGAFPQFELAVEDVPPSDPAPWEVAEVPLGRLFAAHGRASARIVIYRRPITTRAHGDADLAALIAEVVTEQIAALLGVQPSDLDPRWDAG